MLGRTVAVLLGAVVVASCGDDSVTGDEDQCNLASLPMRGNANAPVIVDVGLEVQSHGIVPVATVSDPQGTANVRNILQDIGVFPDAQCRGTPILIRDQLAGVDQEETFGTVIEATQNPTLYNAIAASNGWPVQVKFMDVDQNTTSGRVRARIIR